MQVAVIGLGSMGKRRIKLLQEINPEIGIIGVDARADRRSEAETLGAICHESIDDLNENVQAACICTPPITHSSIIGECLKRGWDVFTEINLVSEGYEANMALAASTGVKLFLSSTFLYRAEIGFIREFTSGQAGSYRYHVGQYLPDWHPWENYRDFFVSDTRTSGVRELLAIELPWLTKLYGEVRSFHVSKSKVSTLDLGYDDTLLLTLEHSSGVTGSLVVDVVSRMAVRDFEFFSESCYLRWGGTPETLAMYDFDTRSLQNVNLYSDNAAIHDSNYASFVVENAYRNELECFLGWIAGGPEPEYGFADDIRTLQFIDSVEACR